MLHVKSLLVLCGVLTVVQPAVSQGQSAKQAPVQHVASVAERGLPLADARSWGYQLQAIEPTVLATTPYDVLVIDYASDGDQPFGPHELAKLKHKINGKPRIVLAYLSIGEAEDYRFYWNSRWASRPPSWLKPANPDWPGNYPVRYWDRDWQGLIYGGPGAYLDRIIAAGFDGVYLDRVDAFDVPDTEFSLPVRMADMSGFVQGIAAYGRKAHPGFIVVAQNGEELLSDAAYRNTIDGLGKEDLFFGIDGDGVPNARADIRASLTPIESLIAVHKPVFLVEYLTDPEQMQLVRSNAAEIGMPVFFGDRELNHAQSR